MRSLVQAFGTTRLGSRDFPSEIFEYSILDFGPMVTGGAFESEERRDVSLSQCNTFRIVDILPSPAGPGGMEARGLH